MIAHAQEGAETTFSITGMLNRINAEIINPAIVLLFALAALLFAAGLIEFFFSSTASDKRERAKKHMIWGIVGLVIMSSVYGIIALLLSSFGIDNPEYLTN